MLKANVGLSRKVSANYNSDGFSVNLEGEIQANLDDPESVIERIRELYDLADEALQRQIEAHQSDSAIASRDVEDQPAPSRSNDKPALTPDRPAPSRTGHREPQSAGNEPATNKQVQFLLTLAKRQRLQGPKLEARIEEILGKACGPYDLSKHEAGKVIDALNPEGANDDRPRR